MTDSKACLPQQGLTEVWGCKNVDCGLLIYEAAKSCSGILTFLTSVLTTYILLQTSSDQEQLRFVHEVRHNPEASCRFPQTDSAQAFHVSVLFMSITLLLNLELHKNGSLLCAVRFRQLFSRT
jgi:hypothetical protein